MAPYLLDMVFHKAGSKSLYPLVTEKCMDTLAHWSGTVMTPLRNIVSWMLSKDLQTNKD